MTTEKSWATIYRLGAAVAFVAVAALLFDIALASMPGWGPQTAPTAAAGWLEQFAENPWLGLRNLDLLNVTVSVVSIPLYLALYGAHRRSEPGLALLGFTFVAVGTALFAAANAALPMLGLAREYAAAPLAERVVLEAAAAGLLARGAHGSLGAFPGFLLSEIGTLVIALAMVRGRVFGRVASWLGVLGAASLIVYSLLMTFALVPTEQVVALAAPGGLALIAWQLLVGRKLWMLAGGRGTGTTAPTVARGEVAEGAATS